MTRPGLAVLRPFKKELELPLETVVPGDCSRGMDSERRVVTGGGAGSCGLGAGGSVWGLVAGFEVVFGGVWLTFGGE